MTWDCQRYKNPNVITTIKSPRHWNFPMFDVGIKVAFTSNSYANCVESPFECFSLHENTKTRKQKKKKNKMKTLNLSIKLWKVCGAYLSPSSTTLDYYLSLVSIFVLSSAQLIFFWLSLAIFFNEKDTEDISRLFYSILQIVGIFSAFVPYISTVLVRRKSGIMIELLQRIVDTSNVYCVVPKMYLQSF